MQRMRPVALLILVAPTLAAFPSGGLAQPGAVITVACRDANGRIAPASAAADGRRVVLGVASVPPAYIPQVVRYPHDGWRYWSKSGLFVQAGNRPLRISVPKAWRTRVAFEWGTGGPVAELRFAACSPPPTYWNAFAGGFSLNTRSACVPLVFQVGQERRTVRFGVGRHCT